MTQKKLIIRNELFEHLKYLKKKNQQQLTANDFTQSKSS